MKKGFKAYVSLILTIIMFVLVVVPAGATTSSDLEKKQKQLEQEQKKLEEQKSDLEEDKKENQDALNEANENIDNISEQQSEVSAQIDSTTEEIVGLIAAIDLIKEDISNTEADIETTQAEYDEAKAHEDDLYTAMKARIKFMYEKGEMSYMQILIEAQGFTDMLNKVQYVEELYEYDRVQLAEYVEAKEAAEEKGEELAEQKSELETSQYELEGEQAALEALLADYQQKYDNYDVMLAKAQQDAAVYTTKLKQQTAQISSLQKEIDAKEKEVKETAKAAQEAASKEAAAAAAASKEAAEKAAQQAKATTSTSTEKTTTTDSDSTDNSGESSNTDTDTSSSPTTAAAGSPTGQNIANYACQFVGNPYVAGGTSLTNGADCSGFVQSVFKAFGISVPRTSYSQATYGKSVSYSEAQAGDVIYYGGHVAIYLGNGRIVHASTAKTGIKYESATYRTIISIRRFY